ncbi:MAG: hypothetical protein AAF202_04715, partial [Pseudomonadota bacterium]
NSPSGGVKYKQLKMSMTRRSSMRNQPNRLILIALFVLGQLSFANQADLEKIYFSATEQILESNNNKRSQSLELFISQLNKKNLDPQVRNVLLKAFFDSTYGNRDLDETAFEILDRSQLFEFSLSQHIQLYLHKQKITDQTIVVDDWFLERHILDEWEKSFLHEDLYTLCRLQPSQRAFLSWVFEKNPHVDLQCKALQHHTQISPPTETQLLDLVKRAPDADGFAGGVYHRKPRLYQFCRINRDHPCQMLLMDEDKNWVRDDNGTPWSLPVLGRSREEIPFNQYGGHTPAGVYTLDGVMPEANKQQVFGKYRRIIMEFIPSSRDENDLKSLLPPSNHIANWWTESTIARDVGRDLFRIHGTLRRNENPASAYYPFFATMGCVATRETEYDGIDYHDQRLLLDIFMVTQGLTPRFSNESRIKGLLYVIEIDDTERAVELDDLERLGLL